jgi:transposase
MADLFGDPRAANKARAAQFVVPESKIREGLLHSSYLARAAKHVGVSAERFKAWAKKYLDAETGLTLYELQQRNLLLEKAEDIRKRPKNNKPPLNKLNLTEAQIREAMSLSNSNKEAAEYLQISTETYKRYAQQFTDAETGMTLYELQHEKWRKINYERFMARKESGYFDRLAERKAKWEAQKFKKGQVPGKDRPEHWLYKGLQLSEEVVRNAIKNTRSNREAAAWLRISYKTWRKYAQSYKDERTGMTLFDTHMAHGGRGVPKVRSRGNRANPRALQLGYQLIQGQLCTPERVKELTRRLMKDGRLGYCCKECGYAQKRPIDMKMPLLLNFINNDRTDWREENLRWLCYNCSFILALDYTNRTTRAILSAVAPESPDTPEEVKTFYNIDDFYLEHLRGLGVKDLAEVVRPQEDTKTGLDDLIDYR